MVELLGNSLIPNFIHCSCQSLPNFPSGHYVQACSLLPSFDPPLSHFASRSLNPTHGENQPVFRRVHTFDTLLANKSRVIPANSSYTCPLSSSWGRLRSPKVLGWPGVSPGARCIRNRVHRRFNNLAQFQSCVNPSHLHRIACGSLQLMIEGLLGDFARLVRCKSRIFPLLWGCLPDFTWVKLY